METKIFTRIPHVTAKQIVTATCPRAVLRRLVLEAIHAERFVGATYRLVCPDLDRFAVPEQQRKTKGKRNLHEC